MKTANMEVMACVIRVFPEGLEYGDPYEYAVACRTLDRHTIEMVGITSPPSLSQWKAISLCLAANGFRTVVFQRLQKDGGMKRKEIRVRGYFNP